MNEASAWLTSCDELDEDVPVLLVLEEVEPDVVELLELVDAVLLVEDVPLVDVVLPTPICCKAWASALTNPPGPPSPPGGGPGGGPMSLPVWVVPLDWPTLLDWLICVNQLNELETLLIVMAISFLI